MSQMIRHLMLLLLALSLVAFQGQAEDAAPAARPAAPATAKDWPLFRGDPLSSGVAHTTLPEKPEQLWKYTVKDGDAVIVPAGAKHNVINTSATEVLQMYTIYSPPHHKDQIIHKTKAEAEASDEEFDGKTTEKMKK